MGNCVQTDNNICKIMNGKERPKNWKKSIKEAKVRNGL